MNSSLYSRRRFLAAMAAFCTGCRAPELSVKKPLAAHGIHYRECAQDSGLSYLWKAPGARPLDILGTIGNGCAFLDFNQDGNLDILLVGPQPALFAGDGKGNFTDVTRQTGLHRINGHFLGCAVGDFNNDGYPDIYLTAYEGGVLLKNERGSGFTEITKEAGIPAQPWGTSAAWVQLAPDDPWLSLLICNYVQFNAATQPRLCATNAVQGACGPSHYRPLYARLYQNHAGKRFQDVSEVWGMQDTHGKALGVACADYNHSGRQSICLANDGVAADLLENRGASFRNIGYQSGVCCDANGNFNGGMGVDWGDYDNDGKLDLAVATFQHQAKCVYHNDGNSLFTEMSGQLALADQGLAYISFGLKWLDCSNNGWLDLVLSNGHIQDNIHEADSSENYHELPLLFINQKGKRLVSAGAGAGSVFQKPIVGRGLAIGDYDNDGRMDILIVNSEGRPLLLHNETSQAGNWLQLQLQGTRSNRDALGASVLFHTGKQTRLRLCHTDGSYMSASDCRVHCGLDTERQAQCTIHWPSGLVEHTGLLHANRIVRVKEGSASSAMN